jgi:ubiquinone/menaquinone biosynthesis C-methylase UbiE
MSKPASKLRRVVNGPDRDRFQSVWRGGPLAADPALCEAFLSLTDILCGTPGKTDAEIYAELRAFYESERDRFESCLVAGREKRAMARAERVRDMAPTDFHPRTFLDIGCGDGLVTNCLSDIFKLARAHTFGIDLAPPGQEGKFKFIGYDSEGKIPAPDNSFGFLTVLMVLHHVPKPEEMLADLARVLSPRGYLLVRDHDTRSRRDFNFFAVMDEIFYTVFDPVPALARDFNYRSKKHWTASFEKAGLEVVKIDDKDSRSSFQPVFFLLRKKDPAP